MHQFTNNGAKSDDSKDINFSTRYDDRELIQADSEEERLDWLSTKISHEITLSSGDIQKMERLKERYESDGNAARDDDNMAYQMRYEEAVERLTRLVDARFMRFHPVNNQGKQDA